MPVSSTFVRRVYLGANVVPRSDRGIKRASTDAAGQAFDLGVIVGVHEIPNRHPP